MGLKIKGTYNLHCGFGKVLKIVVNLEKTRE